MLYKILFVGIVFFVARSFFRSWKMMQEIQRQHEQSKNQNSTKEDQPIDAEYTVVDDKK